MKTFLALGLIALCAYLYVTQKKAADATAAAEIAAAQAALKAAATPEPRPDATPPRRATDMSAPTVRAGGPAGARHETPAPSSSDAVRKNLGLPGSALDQRPGAKR